MNDFTGGLRIKQCHCEGNSRRLIQAHHRAQFSELWLWHWMCMGELWELLTSYRNPGWMHGLSLCLIVDFFSFLRRDRETQLRVPSYNAFQFLIWKCFKQGTSEAEIQSNLLKLKVGLHENELLVCEKSQVWKDRMVSLNEFDSLNKCGEAEENLERSGLSMWL